MKTTSPISILILQILSFLLVPVFIYCAVVNTSLSAIGPATDSYTPSDEETNYLTALSVYRGEGLYRHFSISYPPGRFLAQAAFFHLTDPTVVSARIYMNLFAPLLFPTLLFLLTYRLLKQLFATSTSGTILSYGLSWLALLIDLTLVSSAQEVHVLLAAFGLTLLTLSGYPRLRQLFLGALLGLIFLFRFEAGIITVLTIFLVYRAKPSQTATAGFALVWLPVLGDLLTRGSLTNFFYDTVVLGLITQPRTMGQAIPDNALWYLFLAALIAVLGLSVSLWQKGDQRIKVIAGISLFSYVSALGRSDEGHLWYGLIWLSLLVGYAGWIILTAKLRTLRLLPTLIAGLLAFLLSWLIITIKQPAVFLLLAGLTLICSTKWHRYFREVALGSLLAALLTFHSVQYLTLRAHLPSWPGKLAKPWEQTVDSNAIAGLTFPRDTVTNLASIQSHIVGDNPSLFIFPDHTLYYEYFDLPRPTRYFYLTGERTEKTESEIIRDLENAGNLYILVFPEKATHRGGKIWDWIQSSTSIVYSDMMHSQQVDLRRKN